MKKLRLYLSSYEFLSTAIARVCLAVAKTNFEAAWQWRHPGNATGADLNCSPWAFLSLTVRQAPRHCILLQSP